MKVESICTTTKNAIVDQLVFMDDIHFGETTRTVTPWPLLTTRS